MKRSLFALFLALILACTACSAPVGSASPAQTDASAIDDSNLALVASTYPIYLFAQAVTAGADHVTVHQLNTSNTSCLHDYTLSVDDMKLIDQADVLILNGVDLEEFMEDALDATTADVVDCSAGLDLLTGLSPVQHGDHVHGAFDPHVWLDASNAAKMVQTIAVSLAAIDPENESLYRDNANVAATTLNALHAELCDMLTVQESSSAPVPREVITFHDGFRYFAQAYGFDIVKSIEEEEGSEASAKEINEIVALIRHYEIPAIFTELNGSDATALAIARETGVDVAQLSMIMGDDAGISANGNDPLAIYGAHMRFNMGNLVDYLAQLPNR